MNPKDTPDSNTHHKHPNTTTCKSRWINPINKGTSKESWYCTLHKEPVWPNSVSKPDTPDLEEQKLREQVRRLVVENRNSLNDQITNEPYDMEGVVSDVVALLHQHQNALLRELEGKVVKYTAKHDQYWVEEVKQILADARVGE